MTLTLGYLHLGGTMSITWSRSPTRMLRVLGARVSERRAYANDLTETHHLTVQAAANRSKGARGPGVAPSPAHHCQYARDSISIKARSGLTATAAEWLALLEMLDTCPHVGP